MARSRRSRASSTPRFEAASSSTTSRFAAPVQTRVQESHAPHGSPAGASAAPRRSQFSAMARMRAAVVLPTPRGPANRYPCATRFWATAPRSAAATWSWTMRSANCLGRYFLASAIISRNLTRARPLRARALRLPELPLRGVDGRSLRPFTGHATSVQCAAHGGALHAVGHEPALDGDDAAPQAGAVELALVVEPCPVVVVAHGLSERIGECVEPRERGTRGHGGGVWKLQRLPGARRQLFAAAQQLRR